MSEGHVAGRSLARDKDNWFEKKYREHAGLVLSFLRSRVAGPTADDLSQQVWLKVWTHASSHFDGTNFRAWVLHIARNALVDQFRRTRSDELLADTESVVQKDAVDDRQELLSRRTTALQRCLGQISDELQVVIRARIEGEPYESISERLAIPLGTAHSRFNKAKSQLQKCVSNHLQ